MSFLDTLKKTAGAAAQVAAVTADTAVNKTKTMASIGRVKLAISSEEDKLKKAYTELGRLFYRDYEAQAEADMAEYLPWCGKAAADAQRADPAAHRGAGKAGKRKRTRGRRRHRKLRLQLKMAGAPAPEVPEEDMSIFCGSGRGGGSPRGPRSLRGPRSS